ncbi:uncharacterized protein LOC129802771 [Phlebotomus papatasi]|uniref:uncharacterized protein LOC129802771 n=1 Tax=Phlebotomus papatasi TaxID=29031 RepID=UPI0024844046|nr:uncharacterized protein LOC129802771 [Phlebotomus papatasi]
MSRLKLRGGGSSVCFNIGFSANIVCEYLDFAVNNILFQRGLECPEDFSIIKKYDLSLFKMKEGETRDWLKSIFDDVRMLIHEGRLEKFSLVIIRNETKEIIERWDFVIKDDQKTPGNSNTGNKDLSRINLEIREVMRQITASVTFLPLLDFPCSVEVHVKNVPGTVMPPDWTNVDASIANAQKVLLKSFSTGYHAVATSVCFRDQ